MKVVRVYSRRAEAEMARGFLESQGIVGHVFGDDRGGLDPALGESLGVTLNVAEEDLAAAVEIVNQLDRVPPLEEGESN